MKRILNIYVGYGYYFYRNNMDTDVVHRIIRNNVDQIREIIR